MSTSIEYQLHNLTGRIDNERPADSDENNGGRAALRVARGGPAGYLTR